MILDAKKSWIALALLVAAGGSWWLSQRMVRPESVAESRQRHDPDYVIGDFVSWAYDQHGRRKYLLSAKRLMHYPDDDTSSLQAPLLVQYPAGGAPIYTRAERGVLSDGNSRILMTGNVRSARGRDPHSAGGEIVAERMLIRLDTE